MDVGFAVRVWGHHAGRRDQRLQSEKKSTEAGSIQKLRFFVASLFGLEGVSTPLSGFRSASFGFVGRRVVDRKRHPRRL